MDVSDILSLLGNVGVAEVDFITCEASCKIAVCPYYMFPIMTINKHYLFFMHMLGIKIIECWGGGANNYKYR